MLHEPKHTETILTEADAFRMFERRLAREILCMRFAQELNMRNAGTL